VEVEETEEIILGVGLDDFLKGINVRQKAQAREAEGIKGAKVQANEGSKLEKKATLNKAGIAS
jgi:hypothetical protein